MEDFKISNIYHLESLLKAKIQELHWKTETMGKMNNDLSLSRQLLYNERMNLDKERRRVKELELQLKSSEERIDCLEKDKQRYQQERIALQVNCDTSTKERDSLLNQAQIAKIENLQLFSKIQHLEEKVLKEEAFSEAIKSTQEQFKEDVTKVTHELNKEMLKLKQEQSYFRESVNVINNLHQRLVVMGMCAHIHNREQNETIKDLQAKLNEISMKDVEQPKEIENFPTPEMQMILNDANQSDSDDEDLDKQVEAFILGLQNAEDEE